MTTIRLLAALLLSLGWLICSLFVDWETANEPTTAMVQPPPPIINQIHKRSEARRQIIEGLLAGERTLLQTAAVFRTLNRMSPNPTTIYSHFPGGSEEEKFCRQVISWATAQAPEDQAEATRQSLEKELETHLYQSEGKLVLPEL